MNTLDIDKKDVLKYIKKREEKIETIEIMSATQFANIVKVYFNNGKKTKELFLEVADTHALVKKLNEMDMPVQKP